MHHTLTLRLHELVSIKVFQEYRLYQNRLIDLCAYKMQINLITLLELSQKYVSAPENHQRDEGMKGIRQYFSHLLHTNLSKVWN